MIGRQPCRREATRESRTFHNLALQHKQAVLVTLRRVYRLQRLGLKARLPGRRRFLLQQLRQLCTLRPKASHHVAASVALSF